jgi:hypothetical protein
MKNISAIKRVVTISETSPFLRGGGVGGGGIKKNSKVCFCGRLDEGIFVPSTSRTISFVLMQKILTFHPKNLISIENFEFFFKGFIAENIGILPKGFTVFPKNSANIFSPFFLSLVARSRCSL